MNQAIDHGCNRKDGDIPYSELETLLHRGAFSVVALYCFRPQITQIINGLIDLQLFILLR